MRVAEDMYRLDDHARTLCASRVVYFNDTLAATLPVLQKGGQPSSCMWLPLLTVGSKDQRNGYPSCTLGMHVDSCCLSYSRIPFLWCLVSIGNRARATFACHKRLLKGADSSHSYQRVFYTPVDLRINFWLHSRKLHFFLCCIGAP